MKINKNDLYWIAGLLEGEGCFGCRNTGTKKNIFVTCHMTDLDVLKTLQKKIGHGYVNGPYKNGKLEYKLRYMYKVSGALAKELMELLLPLMGNRRSAKIKSLIRDYNNVKPRIYKFLNLKTNKILEVSNLKTWIKDNNLNESNLWRTLAGQRKQYKGWKRLT